MRKILVTLSVIILILYGFLGLMNELFNKPCPNKNISYCVIHQKYKKYGSDIDHKYRNNHINLYYLRILKNLISLIIGILLIIIKK
tara:strand:- start:109 stop:366 length:258 start_codon:yes stop_codon:yes gene_type:complete